MGALLTQHPVAEAIAGSCRTHHHLTRTFAQVCRAWRDAAREEEYTRLDVLLEVVRQQHIRPFWSQQRREFPFGQAARLFPFYCNQCFEYFARPQTWWHAIDAPRRDLELCSTCFASYSGPFCFIDLVAGHDSPYFICVTNSSDSDRNLIVTPMRIPQKLRWPRTLPGVTSAQLFRAAQQMYDAVVHPGYALSRIVRMSTFGGRAIWINSVTDSLRIEVGYGGESDYYFPDTSLFDKPVAELERDPSFNVLDWIPVVVSYNPDCGGRLLQHVICANPSNARFYGCRAVIINGEWTVWSHGNMTELKRCYSTSLNEPGWFERGIDKHIRARAYAIWQSTQRNDEVANWLQAKREVYDDVDMM